MGIIIFKNNSFFSYPRASFINLESQQMSHININRICKSETLSKHYKLIRLESWSHDKKLAAKHIWELFEDHINSS